MPLTIRAVSELTQRLPERAQAAEGEAEAVTTTLYTVKNGKVVRGDTLRGAGRGEAPRSRTSAVTQLSKLGTSKTTIRDNRGQEITPGV